MAGGGGGGISSWASSNVACGSIVDAAAVGSDAWPSCPFFGWPGEAAFTIQRDPGGESTPPSASSHSWYSLISWKARGTVSLGQPERAATSARFFLDERGSGRAPTCCPLRSLFVLRRSRPP